MDFWSYVFGVICGACVATLGCYCWRLIGINEELMKRVEALEAKLAEPKPAALKPTGSGKK